MHNGRTKLEIEMRFHSLFRDGFGDTLAVSPFELTSEQIAEPCEPEVSERRPLRRNRQRTIVPKEGRFLA
jgi:hypothetical protein